MASILTKIANTASWRKRGRAFGTNEDGTATIEFVILFPLMMALFMMGFESGLYMFRNAMIERAVDVAVRDVRLGNGRIPDYRTMKSNICEQTDAIPDCMKSVQIEMRQIEVTPGAVSDIQEQAVCNDKRKNFQANKNSTVYETGSANAIVMVRVCVLADPIFPTTGLAIGMRKLNTDDYAIVASTMIVAEPGNRQMSSNGNNGTGGNGNNGFGNGDQDAPGESLDNNNAENSQGDTPGNGGNGN